MAPWDDLSYPYLLRIATEPDITMRFQNISREKKMDGLSVKTPRHMQYSKEITIFKYHTYIWKLSSEFYFFNLSASHRLTYLVLTTTVPGRYSLQKRKMRHEEVSNVLKGSLTPGKWIKVINSSGPTWVCAPNIGHVERQISSTLTPVTPQK